MTQSTEAFPAEVFWSRLEASRLLESARIADLRREFESRGRTGGPESIAAATARDLAEWLHQRKHLTSWQARRLLRGEKGPFVIGDYHLLERLENPSRTMLMRARHAPSGRTAILALLDPKRFRGLEAWTGIVNRTTIATQAADPVLSRTWALEDVEGVRFIVCEDLQGPSLADELASGMLPDLRRAGRVTFELARAVAELQRLGTPHGGLFLDAVLSPSGNVRLLQYPRTGDPHVFPVTLPLEDAESIGRLGIRAASIAPELVATGGVGTEAADVYALGAILHVLAGAGLPNWNGSPQATLAAACRGIRPPDPARVPPPVSALLAYMLAPDPAARYPTAFHAAQAIAACFGIEPLPDSAAIPPRQPVVAAPAGAVVPIETAPQAFGPSGQSGALQPLAAADRPRRPAPGGARLSGSRLLLPAIGGAVALGAMLLAALVLTGPASRQEDGENDRPAASPSHHTGDDVPGRGESPPAAADAAAMVDSTAVEPDDLQTGPQPSARREAGPAVSLVDDPDALWESPTHGPPPNLAYLPAGSQLVLTTRLAEALATGEGRRFLEALGPDMQKAVEEASALAGVGPEGIARLTVAWQADEAGRPVVGYVLEADAPLDRTRLKTAWGQTAPRKVGEETMQIGKAAAFCLPVSGGGRLLVVAPEAILSRTLESGGMPLFTPDMEEFVGSLDGDQHVVLFGSPDFLAADGRGLMTGPLARLADPLTEILDESVRAAAVAIHFGTTFYFELAAYPTDRSAAGGLARRLAETVAALPARIETAVASLDPAPYGRTVVLRLPSMIRVVEAYLRHAAEGRLARVNCHLPSQAGHNLALAAEIALQQAGRTVAAVAAAGPKAGGPVAETAAAKLQKTISLAFAKNTLEASIQMLSEEIGLPMEILGADLQLEGITKNQSFGLDEREKTADSILRTILAKANPDGKLVYVLRNRDGVESLEVTTRAAVEKRKDTLPEGF
jgi:hypothetical protein